MAFDPESPGAAGAMAADAHPAASKRLAGLSEAQRSQALQRWRFLRRHVEDAVPLARVADDAGVPERTARRWLARYRAMGLAGLARPARADRSRRRFPADLVALIEGLALRRPAPTAAQVHRQATAVAAEQGWPVPAYGTVYAIIRDIDPAMRMLASRAAGVQPESGTHGPWVKGCPGRG